MTADEVKRILNLQPHPTEGGWYTRTYESTERIPTEAFLATAAATSESVILSEAKNPRISLPPTPEDHHPRYPAPRLTGTAIYYLLEPHTFSELHRLRSDELFHHYLGDPVEMLQLPPGSPGHTVHIGPDLLAGQRPQVLAPRGVWQGSRLLPGGRWALLGCTVAPGFEFEDYESGDRATLCAAWPHWSGLIRDLTR